MNLLLSAQELSKSYGAQNLFTDISFSLNKGERVGLIGPNGSGKSSLLKILHDIEKPDKGTVSKRKGIKIAYVAQWPEFPLQATVRQVLEMSTEENFVEITAWLDRAGFIEDETIVDALSGGWKKRLDVIRALLQRPDLLLLDEPTNHLDMEGIAWIEEILLKQQKSYLVVSHDRAFLNRVCNKIVEINPCFPKGVFSVEGNWSVFAQQKQAFLAMQMQEEKTLRAIVKEEVDWMNRSPKARTTKSKSRIDKAEGLIQELGELQQRNRSVQVDVEFASSYRETRHLIVATNTGKSLGGKKLFSELTMKLSPGTRLGIVGKNGTGKTTLLKILAKELEPDVGTVKYAEGIQTVYFDQHREQLDPKSTLKEALSPRGDFVVFQGESIHVHGWAKRFLFAKERLNLPVQVLSGGEKARILLARLMLQPADVLFLDEPTNDLDIATLDVIEQSLSQFPGAIVLISHDRYLMDRLCTQIVGLGQECQGIFADVRQWQERCHCPPSLLLKKEKKERKPSSNVVKLSYLEQKELSTMEETISAWEEKIVALQSKLAEVVDPQKTLILYQELADMQNSLDDSYARWQVLLDKQNV